LKYNEDMTELVPRDEKGRFIKGAGERGKPIKSSADARMMAQKRWAKARKAAADRVTREAASIDPTVNTWADAWGLVTARQYSALMDSDKPRGDDLLAIGKAIGAMPSDVDKAQAAEVAQPRTQPDVVLALLAVLERVDITDISSSDANVIDADTDEAGGG
jgi:hypothetical protein